MYSLLREAPRLTTLELKGLEFPGSVHGSNPFSALAGASIRYLELRVTRFHDDTRRSLEEALTSVLASLPQLGWLDMSFPRYGGHNGGNPTEMDLRCLRTLTCLPRHWLSGDAYAVLRNPL